MKPYQLADAETDLRDAIDTGDEARIRDLEPIVDRLDVKPAPVSLHSAALYYAGLGLRVFPLSPGSKIPLPKCEACKVSKCPGPEACGHELCHGCKDATTDVDLINRWWTKSPRANVGIATGHLVDVVDVDGVTGQQSRAKHWGDIFGAIDADNIGKVLTPRKGGMHIYLRAVGESNHTNIVPGVDVRGAGGYVVAPPSTTPDGKYQWLGVPNLSAVAS